MSQWILAFPLGNGTALLSGFQLLFLFQNEVDCVLFCQEKTSNVVSFLLYINNFTRLSVLVYEREQKSYYIYSRWYCRCIFTYLVYNFLTFFWLSCCLYCAWCHNIMEIYVFRLQYVNFNNVKVTLYHFFFFVLTCTSVTSVT